MAAPQSLEELALKPGWIKKNVPKSNNVAPVNRVYNSRNLLPSSEDYPVLGTSNSHDSIDASVWTTLKEKVPNSNGINTAVAARGESLSELSRVKCKKIKNPTKLGNGIQIAQPLPFSCETKKKASEIRPSDHKHHPAEIAMTSRGRKLKFDLENDIGTTDANTCIGSKINIVKPELTSIALENNGARPKIKGNTINMCSSEFPALGTSSAPVTSFFDSTHHDYEQLTRAKKGATAKITMTSNSTQHFPSSPNAIHAFLQPPDFSARNQQLIATVMDLLCNQRKKIEKFRTISTQFRSGQLDSKEYYKVLKFKNN